MSREETDDFSITDHARFEMERRGIPERVVNDILNDPGQVIEVRPGRRAYQSRILFPSSDKEYLVRVFVDVDRTPFEVVTVYRTSKVHKYWKDSP